MTDRTTAGSADGLLLTALDLEAVFDSLFLERHRVRLRGGGDEPLYEPPTAAGPGRIVYREDFFASALHEVAHWCVAGALRRGRLDYGYWYAPDGRTPAQQAEFERVEVAPQALEWVFSEACGAPFVPSADNVEAGLGASESFVRALAARKTALEGGLLRGRALRFRDALARRAHRARALGRT